MTENEARMSQARFNRDLLRKVDGLSPNQFAEDLAKAHSEIELFNIYRRYLTHEDELINNRLNWNFTIQGFLFAAYSFSLEKIADVRLGLLSTYIDPQRVPFSKIQHTVTELQVLLMALAVLGIGVSFFVYISVRAARFAIHELSMRWREINPTHDKTPFTDISFALTPKFWKQVFKDDPNIKTHGSNPPGLPGIVGGGHPAANLLGFHAPNGLPLLFMGVWFFLLIDVLFDLKTI